MKNLRKIVKLIVIGVLLVALIVGFYEIYKTLINKIR
jgi:hypothetical protein